MKTWKTMKKHEKPPFFPAKSHMDPWIDTTTKRFPPLQLFFWGTTWPGMMAENISWINHRNLAAWKAIVFLGDYNFSSLISYWTWFCSNSIVGIYQHPIKDPSQSNQEAFSNLTRIFHRSFSSHGLEHEEMYAFVESSGQKEDELAPEEDLLMESWQELSQGSIFRKQFGLDLEWFWILSFSRMRFGRESLRTTRSFRFNRSQVLHQGCISCTWTFLTT